MRTLVAVLAMFIGLGSALALYVLAPDWLQALAVGEVVLALGYLGRKADAPVVHRAVELPKAVKLTSDIVLRALGALGIPAINQAQDNGRDGFEFTLEEAPWAGALVSVSAAWRVFLDPLPVHSRGLASEVRSSGSWGGRVPPRGDGNGIHGKAYRRGPVNPALHRCGPMRSRPTVCLQVPRPSCGAGLTPATDLPHVVRPQRLRRHA
jgi:hypothetical protein